MVGRPYQSFIGEFYMILSYKNQDFKRLAIDKCKVVFLMLLYKESRLKIKVTWQLNKKISKFYSIKARLLLAFDNG